MIIALLSMAAASSAGANVRPELSPLNFLVGHCWTGTLPSGDKDRHCFDTLFGGQHIHDHHEVASAKGLYQGDTFYSWDGKNKQVTFTYLNSSGGVSRGSMKADASYLVFGDDQYVGPDGKVVHLHTRWKRDGDSSYESSTSSEDLKEMNWTVTYRRDQ